MLVPATAHHWVGGPSPRPACVLSLAPRLDPGAWPWSLAAAGRAASRPASAPRLGIGGKTLGSADDGHDQVVALKQARGGALGIGQRHGLDLSVAAVDVASIEALLPEPEELAGNLGVAVEAQREGARQVVFGIAQLLFGRSFAGDAPDPGADHVERVGDLLVLGGDAAGEHAGLLIGLDVGVHRIGKAAL